MPAENPDSFDEWRRRAGLQEPAAPAQNVADLVQFHDEDPPQAGPIVEEFIWAPRNRWLRVVARKDALEKLKDHAYNNRRVEVFGLLVGMVSQQDRTVVTITDIVAGYRATQHNTSFNMSGAAWNDVMTRLDQLRASHREWQVVGWYHTHPNMEIFLSQDDLQVHRTLCRQSWQIALVYDPRSDEAGIFARNSDGEMPTDAGRDDLFRMSDAVRQGMLPGIPAVPAAQVSAEPNTEVLRLTEAEFRDQSARRRGRSGPTVIHVPEQQHERPGPAGEGPLPPPMGPDRLTGAIVWGIGVFIVACALLLGWRLSSPNYELNADVDNARPVLLFGASVALALLASVVSYSWPWAPYWLRLARHRWRTRGAPRQRSDAPPTGRRRLPLKAVVAIVIVFALLGLAMRFAAVQGWRFPVPGMPPGVSSDGDDESDTPDWAGLKGLSVDAWLDPDTGKVTVVWGDEAAASRKVQVYRRPGGDALKAAGITAGSAHIYTEQAPPDLLARKASFSYAIAPFTAAGLPGTPGPPTPCRTLPTVTTARADQCLSWLRAEWRLAPPTQAGRVCVTADGFRDGMRVAKTVADNLDPTKAAHVAKMADGFRAETVIVRWTDPRGNSRESQQPVALHRDPPNAFAQGSARDGTVDVGWTPPDPLDCVLRFNVYRRIAGGEPKLLATLGKGEIQYRDTPPREQLAAGRVSYRVSSVYGWPGHVAGEAFSDWVPPDLL